MGKTFIWKLAKMLRFHEIIRWSHIFQYLHFILLTLYFYLWFCELCDIFDIEGDVETQLNFTSSERTQTPNLCPRHPIKMDLREVSTQIIIDENQTKYSLLQLCNSIPWFSSQGTLFIVALSLSIHLRQTSKIASSACLVGRNGRRGDDWKGERGRENEGQSQFHCLVSYGIISHSLYFFPFPHFLYSSFLLFLQTKHAVNVW